MPGPSRLRRPGPVTTAHRLSLVLALGIVNLVLAAIALSVGLTGLG